MTEFQWQVILALVRCVLHLGRGKEGLFAQRDLILLREALERDRIEREKKL